MVHSSRPGLMVGHVELGQLTYPLTVGKLYCNGKKTSVFRASSASNQMMSKKKKMNV